MKIVTLLFIAIVFISSFGFAQSVTIGTQVWTTKNLDVATFRNGDAIPQAKTNDEWETAGENSQPAWCYYENNTTNGTKYGKLYNWYAVNDARGLAPAGWHIPTDGEWTVLSTYLGEDVAGKKMKSSSGWDGYNCQKCNGGSAEFKKICSACKGTQSNSSEPFSGNGNNSSGFSGLPGGFRFSNGNFYDAGNYGSWRSASEYLGSDAWYRGLYSYYSALVRYYNHKNDGLSVRCVRD
jgi:uncharacterized protein (TIGR02145 family)